ncbi:MAG: hypothetical protein HRT57_09885 [Crocinitomicaceae bacterium]|nr:hypothetical protein [Crocinitomicaceae bacterium]
MRLFLALSALFVIGCSVESESNEDNKNQEVSGPAPTKQMLVDALSDFHVLLKSKKYLEASNHVIAFNSSNTSEAAKQLARLIEKNEISSEGITILSAEGTFQKLLDYDTEAGQMIERTDADPNNCYVLLSTTFRAEPLLNRMENNLCLSGLTISVS